VIDYLSAVAGNVYDSLKLCPAIATHRLLAVVSRAENGGVLVVSHFDLPPMIIVTPKKDSRSPNLG